MKSEVLSQEAWEYLCALRELPFNEFRAQRERIERAWLKEVRQENGMRSRAQPPKEKR